MRERGTNGGGVGSAHASQRGPPSIIRGAIQVVVTLIPPLHLCNYTAMPTEMARRHGDVSQRGDAPSPSPNPPLTLDFKESRRSAQHNVGFNNDDNR